MAAKKKAASRKKAPSDAVPADAKASGKVLSYGDPNVTQEEWAVIQAVREFEVAEQTLAMYEEEHKAIFSEYRELIEERNQKREAADKMVRGKDVSCGPWKRFTETIKWDPDELYQRLGRNNFLAIGGTIGTELVYSIDKDKAELAYKAGNIPRMWLRPRAG
jgi:hypothetical protein